MKAILEFNLPEESAEHLQALRGGAWEFVLFELDQHLRSIVKHGNDEAEADFAQTIRDHIYETMGAHGLDWSE